MNPIVTQLATLVLVIVLPYIVNLCKNDYWNKNVKRWFAIAFSVLAGIATGLISGLPTDETLVMWILAVVGGTQTAYALFKSVGVTSGWLDALEGIGGEKGKTE